MNLKMKTCYCMLHVVTRVADQERCSNVHTYMFALATHTSSKQQDNATTNHKNIYLKHVCNG
jgi:hypothetical protein